MPPMSAGMGALLAGGIGAGAGLIGDIFSSGGQQSTNAMNMAIAQQQDAFAAGQAQLNRNFQQQSQYQSENFDATMSDTAMQRRVADLKAAGLNPYLAIGQGGASAPVVSGMSGSMASPSGNPQMQNPRAAMGSLGSQMGSAASGAVSLYQQGQSVAADVNQKNSSAVTNASQAFKNYVDAAKAAGVDTDLTKAQAANQLQQASTGVHQSSYYDAQTALAGYQAAAEQAKATLDTARLREVDAYVNQQVPAQVAQLMSSKNVNDIQAAIGGIDAATKGFDLGMKQVLAPRVIEQAVNAARASGYEANISQNLSNFAQTEAGKFSPFMQTYGNAIISILSARMRP